MPDVGTVQISLGKRDGRRPSWRHSRRSPAGASAQSSIPSRGDRSRKSSGCTNPRASSGTVSEITPGALPQALLGQPNRRRPPPSSSWGTLGSNRASPHRRRSPSNGESCGSGGKHPIGAQRPWLLGQPPLISVVASYPTSKDPFQDQIVGQHPTRCRREARRTYHRFRGSRTRSPSTELEAVKLTEAACQRLVLSRYPSASGSAETTVEALPALARMGFGPK